MPEAHGGLGFKPLIGTDEATIDEKGRILFSKKKRERLGDDFVVVLGDVGCLEAYPAAVWADRLQNIFRYESINQGRQQYTRLVLGLAEDELKFDAQGRVVIPQKLRTLAQLKDRVLLVGCGDRVEIWDRDQWEEYDRNPEGYGIARRKSIETAYQRMKSGGDGGATP